MSSALEAAKAVKEGLGADRPQELETGLKEVDVVYDLAATRPNELSITAGERLTILRQVDSNWQV